MPQEAFVVNLASKKGLRRRRRGLAWLALLLLAGAAYAQNCLSAPDMDASVRKALETTAQRYFEMSAHGDTTTLRQNSIALVSANFAPVEAAVKENQAAFTGAQPTVRPPFQLTAEGLEPLARAEFLCGVFGKTGQTSNSAVFVLNNLPPGKDGGVILDVNPGRSPWCCSRWAGIGSWQVIMRACRRQAGTMGHGSNSEHAISRRSQKTIMPGCTTARRLL